MSESTGKTLSMLQSEHKAWSAYNFPANVNDYNVPFKGIVEELGELSHSLLKQEQKIRGTHAEHEANAQDALGDMMIYMLDLCNKRGWDLGEILAKTWNQVKTRDWQKFPKNGRNE